MTTVFAMKILLLAALAVGFLVLPLGLPGLWIMVALLLATLPAGWVTWPTLAVLAGLALVAELLEFAVVKWMGDRYGGSRASFWGAVVGGLVGVMVGLPVPLAGPILAGCLGTFLGAGVVTFARSRSVRDASRVGWGVMLARVLAVGLKVGVGVVVLVVGGGALFVE